MTIWRVLQDEKMHPFRTQKVHALLPADYQPHVDCGRWYFHQNGEQQGFGAHVLFTDECTFAREGVFIRTSHARGHLRTRMPHVLIRSIGDFL